MRRSRSSALAISLLILVIGTWWVASLGRDSGEAGLDSPGLARGQSTHDTDGRGLVEVSELPAAVRDPERLGERSDQTSAELSEFADADSQSGGEGQSPVFDASGGVSEWERRFEGWDWTSMRQRSFEIMDYIKTEAKDELDRLVRAGEYQVVSTTGAVSGLASGSDRLITGLDLLKFEHGGEVQRYRVPKTEYPDLYALADKAHWLEMQSFIKERMGQ